MIILAVGDVVGEPGLEALRRGLYRLKRDEGVDFCVVNGENSAKGMLSTAFSASPDLLRP